MSNDQTCVKEADLFRLDDTFEDWEDCHELVKRVISMAVGVASTHYLAKNAEVAFRQREADRGNTSGQVRNDIFEASSYKTHVDGYLTAGLYCSICEVAQANSLIFRNDLTFHPLVLVRFC